MTLETAEFIPLSAPPIRQGVRTLGPQIRLGLHAGECELVGEAVGGIAVHIGARVMAKAGVDEVLVSSAVKDLVAESGMKFKDRGAHRSQGRTRNMALLP